MKKILVVFWLFLLFCANADELIIQQSVVNLENKPTDEEIKATIEKYNFDKKQKEVLFKQMKKEINEMYQDNKNDCPKPDYVKPPKSSVDTYLENNKPPVE